MQEVSGSVQWTQKKRLRRGQKEVVGGLSTGETDGIGLAPAVQEGGTGGKFLTGGSLGLKGTSLSAAESRAVSRNTPVSGLAA